MYRLIYTIFITLHLLGPYTEITNHPLHGLGHGSFQYVLPLNNYRPIPPHHEQQQSNLSSISTRHESSDPPEEIEQRAFWGLAVLLSTTIYELLKGVFSG
ncbi:hypothetical protein PPYR_10395 [Photinus pyralis]|uniref:Uncharacterized protein n=1 Tax=Photinus pyralis TaxID=7054 RepID=A0A5N4AG96_PHOPY|nr:hypothetical protein PPYR_10395 [Photinus pyralis]